MFAIRLLTLIFSPKETFNVVSSVLSATNQSELSLTAQSMFEVTANIDASDKFKVNVTAKADYETNFKVTFGDATNEAPQSFLEGQTISHTYANVGTYTVKVIAYSGGAASTEFTKAITIVNPVLLPLDFENTTLVYDIINFDGGDLTIIDNSQKTGINTSSKVAKMIKKAGQTWGGSILKLGGPIDFTTGKYFRMKVYSPRVGAKVLLKVENPTDNTISFEKEATTTSANAWEELVFDYTAIDASKTYQNVVLIFDNGTAGDGSANFTFLIDEIKNTADGSVLGLPLNFESSTLTYSFSNFDGGNTTVVNNPFATGINTSLKVAKMVKNAGQTWGGSIITLSNPIDFSVNKYFKMKVYSPRTGAKVLLKVENLTNGGVSFEKEMTTTVANAWDELTFDYSTISTSNSYQKIVLIFDNGTLGDGSANFTFYLDDLKLTNSPAAPAETSIYTFETGTFTFTNFDGGNASVINNPNSGGINTSAKVGQMIKNAGQTWGGSWIDYGSPFDFSTNKIFAMKVYSPRVGAKVLLKVENGTNGGINFEKEVVTTKANTWEILYFDYSAINTANSYQKIVLIFDNGTAGDGSANYTFLFDDIKLIASIPPVPTGTNLLNFESGTFTFTDFDGGAVTVINNPQSSGINTSLKVGQMKKNAGQTWGGSWTDLGTPIDFSTKKTMKMKVYSPRVGAKVLLKVENATNGGINFEKEVLTTIANAWEELTFDYSAINTANSYQKIVLIFDNGTAGDGSANYTFLFDDITLFN